MVYLLLVFLHHPSLMSVAERLQASKRGGVVPTPLCVTENRGQEIRGPDRLLYHQDLLSPASVVRGE